MDGKDILGMRRWVVGVLLACFASIISNLGINLQKLCHLQSSNWSDKQPSSPTAPTTASALSDIGTPKYFLQPLWVAGITLVMVGAIADFFALAFAPQVVIAPLGAVTLIANVIFAPLLLREKISCNEIVAVCIIISGSILSVSFASHEDKLFQLDELFALYVKPAFLIFSTGVMAAIAVMSSAVKHYDQLRAEAMSQSDSIQMLGLLEGCDESDLGLAIECAPAVMAYQSNAIKIHRFLYPALSGTIGAQNVLFAKCTAELLYGSIAGGKLMFAHLPTYVVFISLFTTIFFQIKYLNDGLRLFEASYVVPVFQTFWCIGSVASGLIFFGEYEHMQPGQMSMFAFGIGVTISGLLILSRREEASHLMMTKSNWGRKSRRKSTAKSPKSEQLELVKQLKAERKPDVEQLGRSYMLSVSKQV